MENFPSTSRPGKLPRNYAQKIAAATGYSRSLVYKVAQGIHENEEVEYFLKLAKTNKLAFAKAVEEDARAQELLNKVG